MFDQERVPATIYWKEYNLFNIRTRVCLSNGMFSALLLSFHILSENRTAGDFPSSISFGMDAKTIIQVSKSFKHNYFLISKRAGQAIQDLPPHGTESPATHSILCYDTQLQ